MNEIIRTIKPTQREQLKTKLMVIGWLFTKCEEIDFDFNFFSSPEVEVGTEFGWAQIKYKDGYDKYNMACQIGIALPFGDRMPEEEVVNQLHDEFELMNKQEKLQVLIEGFEFWNVMAYGLEPNTEIGLVKKEA